MADEAVVQIEGAEGDPATYDWGALVGDLNRLLRLRTTPIGMKLFESESDLEGIQRLRRPSDTHTTDQIVAQAARLGGISDPDACRMMVCMLEEAAQDAQAFVGSLKHKARCTT